MKLSHHARLRMTERANIPKQNQKQFYISAIRKGKSAGVLKEGKLKEYLLQLEKSNCKVKYYKGYVFIHSKNSKKLYTMYKLPKELLESEANRYI